MPALALFDVLKDFGPPKSAGYAAGGPRTPEPRPEPLAPAMPDIAAIVRDEVAKAEAALHARLQHAHQAELEALAQSHAAETEAMAARFGDAAGHMIVARMDEMEGRIGDIASATAARILGSFLSDEFQKRSIESLAGSIREAAGDREAVRIEVRGPQSLFETLQAALGERAGRLHYIEAPGFDLIVAIDGNLFETRLAEWSAAMSEILA